MCPIMKKETTIKLDDKQSDLLSEIFSECISSMENFTPTYYEEIRQEVLENTEEAIEAMQDKMRLEGFHPSIGNVLGDKLRKSEYVDVEIEHNYDDLLWQKVWDSESSSIVITEEIIGN